MKRIRVSGFNSNGVDQATLERWLHKRAKAGDVAITLTEVWARHREIAAVVRELPGRWRMLAEDPINGGRNRHPITEHGDTVLLVGNGFRLDDWEVVPLTRQWTVFSTGRAHQPRRLIRATGTLGDQRVEVVAVHGPTGGNAAAVAEFKSAVSGIINRTGPDTLTVVVGDFNVTLTDAKPWAKTLGASVAGRGPDLALVAGGTVRSRRGRTKLGSDHYPMAHRIKPRTINRRKKG